MESTLNREHTEFCKVFNSPRMGQILITFGDESEEAKKNGEFDCAFFRCSVFHPEMGIVEHDEDIGTPAELDKLRSAFKSMTLGMAESYAKSCIEDAEAEHGKGRDEDESPLSFFVPIGKAILFIVLVLAFCSSVNETFFK